MNYSRAQDPAAPFMSRYIFPNCWNNVLNMVVSSWSRCEIKEVFIIMHKHCMCYYDWNNIIKNVILKKNCVDNSDMFTWVQFEWAFMKAVLWFGSTVKSDGTDRQTSFQTIVGLVFSRSCRQSYKQTNQAPSKYLHQDPTVSFNSCKLNVKIKPHSRPVIWICSKSYWGLFGAKTLLTY